jgi:two-component system, LytTR family, sensor kinase
MPYRAAEAAVVPHCAPTRPKRATNRGFAIQVNALYRYDPQTMPVPLPDSALMDPHDTRHARLFWLLHGGGWLAYFVYSCAVSLGHGKPVDYWPVIASSTFAGFLLTLGLRYLLRYFLRLPWPQFIAAATLPILLCSLLLSQAYLYALLQWGCADCRPTSVAGYVAYIGSFTYVVLSWVGLYFGIKTYLRLQWQTRETLRANAMAHQAQLQMLRYQLNPHFLFNTLNAISTLILDQDGSTANRMVGSLSAFLRYSLDADPVQKVTLKQELEAIQLYLGIEKIRFAERLNLRSDIEPDAYSALLPSLLLQPLIENAVKYAVAKRIEGGSIEIAARRDGEMLEIAVRDDGPGFDHAMDDLPEGNGVGLRNTRDRLRVLYGAKHRFVMQNRSPRGAEILLRLPFESSGAARG